MELTPSPQSTLADMTRPLDVFTGQLAIRWSCPVVVFWPCAQQTISPWSSHQSFVYRCDSYLTENLILKISCSGSKSDLEPLKMRPEVASVYRLYQSLVSHLACT